MRSGPAIIHLPSGAEYEGQTLYDGHAVTLEGCRRHVDGVGDERTVRRYQRIVRTWPIEAVAAVDWQEP